MSDNSFLPFQNLNDIDFLDTLDVVIDKFLLDDLDKQQYFHFDAHVNNSVDDSPSCFIFKEIECNYYFCNSKMDLSSSNNFNLISYNISSIPRHLEEFHEQCLTQFKLKFHIIDLCETRLNDSIASLYHMNEYNAHFQNKSTSSGGLAIYLHKL